MNQINWPSTLCTTAEPIIIQIAGIDTSVIPQYTQAEIVLQNPISEGRIVSINGYCFYCSNEAGSLNFTVENPAFCLALLLSNSALGNDFKIVASSSHTLLLVAKYPGIAFTISVDNVANIGVASSTVIAAADCHTNFSKDAWYEARLHIRESSLTGLDLEPIHTFQQIPQAILQKVNSYESNEIDIASVIKSFCNQNDVTEPLSYVQYLPNVLFQIWVQLYVIKRDLAANHVQFLEQTASILAVNSGASLASLQRVSSQNVAESQYFMLELGTRKLYRNSPFPFPICWAVSGLSADYPSGNKGQKLIATVYDSLGNEYNQVLADTTFNGSGYACVGFYTDALDQDAQQVSFTLKDNDETTLSRADYTFTVVELPAYCMVVLYLNSYGVPEQIAIPLYSSFAYPVINQVEITDTWHTTFLDEITVRDLEKVADAQQWKVGIWASSVLVPLATVKSFTLSAYKNEVGFQGKAFTIQIG